MSSHPDDAAPQRPRPTQAELLERWERYFADPLLSLAVLRGEAEQGTLEDKRGLRSLSWRYFFGILPSPAPLSDTPSAYSTYELLLSQSRSHYTELRERYLRSPDGRWINDGGTGAGASSTGHATTAGQAGLAKVDAKANNPLGLDEENPWQAWFLDLELRKTIRQDVLRTFPEVDFFREPTTQDRLVDLLFVYCKLTPEIGYRQGMHELLAPLLWYVDYDSLEPLSPNANELSLAHLVLAREWVEHDTWALFSALMKSASPFYDHTPSRSLSLRPPPAPGYPPSASTPSSSSTALVQPIVAVATHLHSLLATLDPPLHAAFTRLQVEPQLYAIRWLRLLFSREFPLPDTLVLWDGLFALDPSLHLTTHIALAMLLRIRDALLGAARDGYGEFLQVLLRYPPCPDAAASFRPALLVQQALYLRDHLSPAAAAHIRAQNVQLGASVGEPSSGPPSPDEEEQYDLRRPAARQAAAHRRSQTAGNVAALPQGLGFLSGEGLVGDLAKGVYGRAEALGINKALMGTFNEIKRGVAEASALAEERRRQQARFSTPSPSSPSSFGPPSAARPAPYSQIPTRAPWDPQRSPPPPPVAAKDALSDLAAMRAQSIAMSRAVDICVNALERAASAEGESVGAERAGMMALTALKHVRDVLGGQAHAFDPAVIEPLTLALSVPEEKVRDDEPKADATPSPVPVAPSASAKAPPPTAASSASTTSASGLSVAPVSSPQLHLSARTDKPLPSLSQGNPGYLSGGQLSWNTAKGAEQD
ncbi:hypothetical protein Rhopal_000055-T1 [Rhodotorula paludigena]|uniref:Rab-GAP TBC domain-containing protein n=1 Tax=Rhodotorula paludigena TaxID=86838 RepID=A0AAV5G4C0_9BASI|nr:hypothetical protein Rhopal_000055-T1 [Rhodotorula paludigena]